MICDVSPFVEGWVGHCLRNIPDGNSEDAKRMGRNGMGDEVGVLVYRSKGGSDRADVQRILEGVLSCAAGMAEQ